jgi:phosphate starvation-inducible PhoH-like protein
MSDTTTDIIPASLVTTAMSVVNKAITRNADSPISVSKLGNVMLSLRNESQIKYVNCLNDKNTNVVIAVGPAGTGKTLFATHIGVQKLLQNKVSKIILTRPIVSVDEDIGFLPGGMHEKMMPWIRPIYDVLLKYFTENTLTKMFDKQKIEICPLALMRGRTFENTWVICDEAQNTTPSQMKMILTRIGKGSTVVITGDNEQHDRGFDNNGLIDIIRKVDSQGQSAINKGIHVVKFQHSNVERHPTIKFILDLYN